MRPLAEGMRRAIFSAMLDWLSFSLLAAVATALLTGGMVFFAGIFAPLVFVKLPMETAGGFIRQVFPVYYLAGGTAAAAGGLLALPDRPWDGLALLAVATGFAVARQGLMPRINAERDRELGGEAAAGRRFARLHRLSVALNGLQLAVASVVLVRLALAA
jgi:hypothetical protein